MSLPVFADASWWLDPDLMKAGGGIIAGAVAAAVPLLFSRQSEKKKKREAEVHASEVEAKFEEMKRLFAGYVSREDYDKLKADFDEATAAAKRDAYAAAERVADAVAARTTAEQERDAVKRRVKKALDRDGATWTDSVLRAGEVAFRPLSPDGRRTPVISVLNLKGGVGKTTAVANLGAALAHRGHRVLLLDLDLQGSLSSRFLPDAELKRLFDAEKMASHFLRAAFDAEHPNLLDYACPIPGLPTASAVVPTTDELAYTEMTLNVRWFLRDGKRDPRFLLRKRLQLKQVTDKFDVVLIDCPPLINASCVNALVASDYVLVPVMPSRQSTDRVTVLLERLKQFRDNLNSELHVLGVFANRTKESRLTLDEANRLAALRDQCRDVWGTAVPVFDRFIRQSVEVKTTEDEGRPLTPEDEMFAAYAALAGELEDRLPMYCRPSRQTVTPATLEVAS